MDTAATIDSGTLILEIVRTAGPVGVIVLAALWARREAKREPDAKSVVQLLTEIRDLLRDGSHERKSLREDHQRIETRLNTPLNGLPTIEAR